MKHLYYKLLAAISVLPTFFLPVSVFAQGTTGTGGLKGSSEQLKAVGTQLGTTGGLKGSADQLKNVGTALGTTGGGTADLPTLIGKLINAFLGVLGIVFVLLTVYAGYLYMTAQGSAEKTEKAKTLLGQAVIGLVIIVAAYSIANFVISQLLTATS